MSEILSEEGLDEETILSLVIINEISKGKASTWNTFFRSVDNTAIVIYTQLNAVRAAILLDSEGKRLIAKYYSSEYATTKDQKTFEKALFEKTRKGNNEIILFDGLVVVYKSSVDTFLYLVGGADENELMLSSCLQSFHDALSILLGQVEKRTLLENGDLVMLALDETIDDGIILESEASQIAARVTKKGSEENLPLSEQTIAQALKSAQEQLAKSLLK
ncbi:Coatomer subunit zeta-1 [Phlyctochytrium bullatum]|nr:Coatomer subunit zeta-1 [Phlyctochytrium bullatum]